MGCPEKDCCTHGTKNAVISFPDTFDHDTPWKFYNHLIGGIPEGVLVRDYCLGTHWTYVEAECGSGVSFTTRNGAKRQFTMDLRGLPLRSVAELSKSWCFEEASLGVAALNAWYSRAELLDPLGVVYDAPDARDEAGRRGGFVSHDAFELYRPRIEALSAKRAKAAEAARADSADGATANASMARTSASSANLGTDSTSASRPRAHVTVVGHFPHVDRITEYADLTVLERSCRDGLDTPDPACEYVLPKTDFAFITGVTIINKTAPRLLDLTKNATTVFVGPSVVMTPFLFDWGVEMLAGSIVGDVEKLRFAVKNGAGQLFGEALQMASLAAHRRGTHTRSM